MGQNSAADATVERAKLPRPRRTLFQVIGGATLAGNRTAMAEAMTVAGIGPAYIF